MWLSHFANRPGQLFSGAQNRLSIFITGPKANGRFYSTRYHRWSPKNGERDYLFHLLRYTSFPGIDHTFKGLVPKIGNPIGESILKKIQTSKSIAHWLIKSSKYPIYWVRVPGYFCQFFLSPPLAKPEDGGPARIRGEVNSIYLPDEQSQRIVHSILNSSTYYLFFCAYTDGRHVNPSDVKSFPFDLSQIKREKSLSLVNLSKELESAMCINVSYWRKSGLLIESVDSRLTKTILDKIDEEFTDHFGITTNELDFIINHTIKYRMGQ
jgi:hypothetical protein